MANCQVVIKSCKIIKQQVDKIKAEQRIVSIKMLGMANEKATVQIASRKPFKFSCKMCFKNYWMFSPLIFDWSVWEIVALWIRKGSKSMDRRFAQDLDNKIRGVSDMEKHATPFPAWQNPLPSQHA